MNFAELLRKYQQQQTTPEETALVEAELAKHAALEEYLAQQLDQQAAAEWLAVDPAAAAEVAALEKSVKRRLNRTVWKSLLLVLGLLLLAGAAVFAMRYYQQQHDYDPHRGYPLVDSYRTTGQFRYNIDAYLELHCPGTSADWALAEPLGGGQYRLQLRFRDDFAQTVEDREELLVRGEINEHYRLWPLTIGNAFANKNLSIGQEIDGVTYYGQQAEERQGIREEMARLSESSRLSVYLTFDRELSLTELRDLLAAWPQLSWYYAAVRTGEGRQIGDFGFIPQASGLIPEEDPALKADYPYFYLFDYYWQTQQDPETYWGGHFRDLLRFQSNSPQFLQAFSYRSPLDYQEALAYVEANGIQIYGALVSGLVGDLLPLEQEANILSFYVDDIRYSSFQKTAPYTNPPIAGDD